MSSAAAADTASPPGSMEVELAIGDMTCAACAARVEEKLSAIEGVASRVNFATENATGIAPLSVSVPQLIEAIDVIRFNLAWAFGYNIAAIPLAAAGYLNPLIAGAAMAASPAFVAASSVRLRRFAGTGPATRERRHPRSRHGIGVARDAQRAEEVASCPG
jgi:cation transport ATPase